jgi:hypothetical protein
VIHNLLSPLTIFSFKPSLIQNESLNSDAAWFFVSIVSGSKFEYQYTNNVPGLWRSPCMSDSSAEGYIRPLGDRTLQSTHPHISWLVFGAQPFVSKLRVLPAARSIKPTHRQVWSVARGLRDLQLCHPRSIVNHFAKDSINTADTRADYITSITTRDLHSLLCAQTVSWFPDRHSIHALSRAKPSVPFDCMSGPALYILDTTHTSH